MRHMLSRIPPRVSPFVCYEKANETFQAPITRAGQNLLIEDRVVSDTAWQKRKAAEVNSSDLRDTW